MELILIQIIKSLLLGWLIYAYEPLKDIRELIEHILPLWMKPIWSYATSFLDCWKCCSFICALFITQDIYASALCALLAFKMDPYINRIKL